MMLEAVILVVGLGIYLGLHDIADSLKDPKKEIKRNMLGMVKKAEIIKKEDEIEKLLELP